MKIRGFEIVRLAEGVEFLRLSIADIPLEKVLNLRITDVPESGRLVFEEDRYNRSEIWANWRFNFKGNLKGESGRGLIRYDEVSHLAAFLAKNCSSCGYRDVDKILAKRSSDSSREKEIERFLKEVESEDRFGRSYREEKIGNLPFFSREQRYPSRLLDKLLLAGGSRYAFPTVHDVAVAGVDYDDHVGGVTVPRLRFIAAVSRNHTEENGSSLFIYWDGIASGLESRFEEMPRDLVEEIDSAGRMLKLEAKDLWPQADLEPVVLLRVPTISDVRRVMRHRKVKDVVPERNWQRPLFMKDTRGAVRIPEDIEVVTSVADALYILARTNAGCYIPGDMPNLRDSVFEEKPYYVAGCVIGRSHRASAGLVSSPQRSRERGG